MALTGSLPVELGQLTALNYVYGPLRPCLPSCARLSDLLSRQLTSSFARVSLQAHRG